MPNHDKTGPTGKGAMTGRGLGACSDPHQVNSTGITKRGIGRRLGNGRIDGCCRRCVCRNAQPSSGKHDSNQNNNATAKTL
ncbi:DUF5320 domain-containing protein [Candidatus Gracilibacteria bacterium]|nr:DUF5320 domain-containing protein [Candidatus Gracilibacteria bacterium]